MEWKFCVRAETVKGAMSQSAAASSRFWRIMWMRIRGRGQRKPWTSQVGILELKGGLLRVCEGIRRLWKGRLGVN